MGRKRKKYRRRTIIKVLFIHGTTPDDLPIQQPVKSGLVINLKTTKVLGLTMPPTLLAIADEVIE